MTFWATAVGRTATAVRAFDASDVAAYRAVVGGATTDIVPGPLLSGLFSRLLGMDLPGNGSLYLNQTTVFHDSARVGETVTARVTVTAVRPESGVVTLRTEATVHERLICDGTAIVLARQHPLD